MNQIQKGHIFLLEKLKEVTVKTFGKGGEVYLVGGCVRDLLLKRPISDWDIAVGSEPKESSKANVIAISFARSIGGHFVVLDDKWQTYRVVVNHSPSTINQKPTIFDFAPLRGNNIEEDLCQRDYTINAMAINIFDFDLEKNFQETNILDPMGGKQDLKNGVLRVTHPKAFLDDPLRILRGFRLAANLSRPNYIKDLQHLHLFSLEGETKQYIKKYAPHLKSAASERIYQELKKLFSAPLTSFWVKEMDSLGVLKVLIPEIERLKNIPQDGFHHLDVFNHSLLTLEKMENLINYDHRPQDIYHPPLASNHQLKWAALCHDIGKPLTINYQSHSINQCQRQITFHGHDKVGAEVFQKIALRLCFPKKETQKIVFLIRNHMWPFHLFKLFINPSGQKNNRLTPRAIHRFLRKTEPYTLELLLLAMADNLAAQGPGKPKEYDQEFKKFLKFLLKEREKYLHFRQMPRLVTGYDIMNWFGLKPGPIIGKMLAKVEEAYLRGEVKTKEEVYQWLKRSFFSLEANKNSGIAASPIVALEAEQKTS